MTHSPDFSGTRFRCRSAPEHASVLFRADFWYARNQWLVQSVVLISLYSLMTFLSVVCFFCSIIVNFCVVHVDLRHRFFRTRSHLVRKNWRQKSAPSFGAEFRRRNLDCVSCALVVPAVRCIGSYEVVCTSLFTGNLLKLPFHYYNRFMAGLTVLLI